MKASNQVPCKTDLSGKTGTKNDITEHVMENLPTEDEKREGENGDESKNSDNMSAHCSLKRLKRGQWIPKILTRKNIHQSRRKGD